MPAHPLVVVGRCGPPTPGPGYITGGNRNKKKCLSLTDSFYPVENTLLRVQARRECSKLVLSRHFTTHRVILVPVNITHILEAQSGQLEETKKGSGDHSYLR